MVAKLHVNTKVLTLINILGFLTNCNVFCQVSTVQPPAHVGHLILQPLRISATNYYGNTILIGDVIPDIISPCYWAKLTPVRECMVMEADYAYTPHVIIYFYGCHKMKPMPPKHS